jgi:hypothetical protein
VGPRAFGAPAKPPAGQILFYCIFKQMIPLARNLCYKLSHDCFDLRSARAAGRRRAANPRRFDDFISSREAKKEQNSLGGWA